MFVWEMAEYTKPGYQKEYNPVFFLIPTGGGGGEATYRKNRQKWTEGWNVKRHLLGPFATRLGTHVFRVLVLAQDGKRRKP